MTADSEGSTSLSWVILVLVLNRPGFSNPHPQMHRHSPQEQGKGSTNTSHLHSRPWAAVGKEASKLERGLWTQCTPSPPRLGLCSGLRTHLLTCSQGAHSALVTMFPYLPGHPFHVQAIGLGVGAPLSTCSTHLVPCL